MAMQYIGARYVPIVYTNPDDSSANWKANVPYEPLTIVVDNGDSYTSKKAVPDNIGEPADNPEYWVKTGDFNASLLALQNEVHSIETKIGADSLETESQSVIGGINEILDITNEQGNKIKVLANFRAQRECSSSVRACQSFVQYNDKYIWLNDTGSTFDIDIVDIASLSITANYHYNYAVHPNACAIYNNKLYVVDSDNHDVYIISLTTFEIEIIDTSLRTYNILSVNTDENGKLYYLGRYNGGLVTILANGVTPIEILTME